MPLAIGQVLQNRYRIDALLGEGGMGAVYRAFDLPLSRPCAVKELVPPPGMSPAEVGQLRQQFAQEASVLANLSHSGLPRVTDHFPAGPSQFLVMDYVEGQSLEKRVEQAGGRGLDEAQVLAWAGQLLDALAYCHSCGVFHRDIKPANIIITPQNRVVLVDFGLVKVWDPRNPHTMTIVRGMGTLDYAPPEQYATGPAHTDARSDVYSLGATLYHALTGRPPVGAPQRFAHPSGLLAPRSLNPLLSPRTEAAVLRAMALDQGQRFQSAAEMLAALSPSVPTAPVVSSTPQPGLAPALRPGTVVIPRSQPPLGPARTNRLPWIAAGAALLLAVIALVSLFRGLDGGTPTPAPPTTALTAGATRSPSSTPLPPGLPTARPTDTPPGPTQPPPTEPPPTEPPPTEPPPTEPPSRAEQETALLGRVTWRPENGPPVFAYYVSRPPAIDGSLEGPDEWPGDTYSVDAIVSKPENTLGPADLSGWFTLGWDAGYLYLGVQLRDDLHVNASTGKLLYKGDDVELQTDIDLAGDWSSAELSSDDGQVGLAVLDLPAGLFDAYVWRPPGHEGTPNVRMAARQADGGYVLEAAVPWPALGYNPQPETPYGFCLSFGDNDTQGTAVQESMASNCPRRKWGDPTTWGTLILVDW